MTTTSAHLSTIQKLSAKVATLRTDTAEEIALVAFMAGALYSITRAIQCRFDDERMTPELSALSAELPEVMGRLKHSQEPPRAWLSGFYIDSAMHRLDALGDRLGKHIGPRRPLAPQVPEAVNMMKHDVAAGITSGWDVRFADVMQAAEDTWQLLAKAIPLRTGTAV